MQMNEFDKVKIVKHMTQRIMFAGVVLTFVGCGRSLVPTYEPSGKVICGIKGKPEVHLEVYDDRSKKIFYKYSLGELPDEGTFDSHRLGQSPQECFFTGFKRALQSCNYIVNSEAPITYEVRIKEFIVYGSESPDTTFQSKASIDISVIVKGNILISKEINSIESRNMWAVMGNWLLLESLLSQVLGQAIETALTEDALAQVIQKEYDIVCEPTDWAMAQSVGTQKAYEEFLERYPSGTNRSQAKDNLDHLMWLETQNADSIDAYERYIEDSPRSRFAEQAESRIEQLIWQKTQNADTERAYKKYLHRYHKGQYATEARDNLDQIIWHRAVTANSKESYEEYLDEQPNGRFGDQARNNLDQIIWDQAVAGNSEESYEEYLHKQPRGRFRNQASAWVDQHAWKETQDVGSIVSYRDYLKKHPNGRHAAEAQSWFDEAEQKYWNEATSNNGLAGYSDYLTHFPDTRRHEELFRRLEEQIQEEPNDDLRVWAKSQISEYRQDRVGREIRDGMDRHKVDVAVVGSTIKEMTVRVKRLTAYPIKVRIPAGTYFVCRGSAQNMVSRETVELALEYETPRTVKVKAACANRSRPIPSSSHAFDVQGKPEQTELRRLMPLIEQSGETFAVAQAAVWIMTDNADYEDLGILRSVSSLMRGVPGMKGNRMILEAHTVRAMQLCEQAGINITIKKIWNDRDDLLAGLEDEKLAQWLEQNIASK